MLGRRRWTTVALAVALAAVWPSVYAATSGGLSVLLGPGDLNRSHQYVVREVPDLPSFPGATGHDGQQFYVIARNVLHPAEGAEHLNEPVYRYRRILYPAVAGVLAPGGGLPLVGALLLVGLLGVAIGAWGLARFPGAPPWLPLVIGVTPGVIVSLILSLADALALGLVLAAFSCAWHGRWVATTVLGTLAVLTRETALLAVVALCFTPGASWRARLAVVAVPASVLAGWTLWLTHIFPGDAGEGFTRNIDFSLGGWRRPFSDLRTPVVAGAEAVIGVVTLLRARGAPHVRVYAGLHLLLLATLSEEVTFSWVNPPRASVGLLAFGAWVLTRRAVVEEATGAVPGPAVVVS